MITIRAINLRFSIHDSTANGTIVYQETQPTVTSSQGLIGVFVGMGSPAIGIFAGINWGNTSKFLQVEIDVNGGYNYTELGNQQLMSVPYALYDNASKNTDTALYIACYA